MVGDGFEDLGKRQAEDNEGNEDDVARLKRGLVGGDAGKGVGFLIEIGHLGIENTVEADIGHENGHDGDVSHAPFTGLESEIFDDLAFAPFFPAEEVDTGGQQFGDGEDDTEA